MAAHLRVLALSVIGKNGNPLFLKSYASRQGGEADLKWHYAAHTSLDFFEERDLPAAKTTETYLGLLYAMEDYAVYGYQSNTRIKFVLILALANALVRDADVKTLFRAVHNAYIDHISNPFTGAETAKPAEIEAPIRSKQFERNMDEIAGVEANQVTMSIGNAI